MALQSQYSCFALSGVGCSTTDAGAGRLPVVAADAEARSSTPSDGGLPDVNSGADASFVRTSPTADAGSEPPVYEDAASGEAATSDGGGDGSGTASCVYPTFGIRRLALENAEYVLHGVGQIEKVTADLVSRAANYFTLAISTGTTSESDRFGCVSAVYDGSAAVYEVGRGVDATTKDCATGPVTGTYQMTLTAFDGLPTFDGSVAVDLHYDGQTAPGFPAAYGPEMNAGHEAHMSAALHFAVVWTATSQASALTGKTLAVQIPQPVVMRYANDSIIYDNPWTGYRTIVDDAGGQLLV